jgi:hypothetical protein
LAIALLIWLTLITRSGLNTSGFLSFINRKKLTSLGAGQWLSGKYGKNNNVALTAIKKLLIDQKGEAWYQQAPHRSYLVLI